MAATNVTHVDESGSARYLELVVLALLLVGLLMSYSANAPYGVRTGDLGATFRGLQSHGVKVLVALGFFFVGARMRLDFLARHPPQAAPDCALACSPWCSSPASAPRSTARAAGSSSAR